MDPRVLIIETHVEFALRIIIVPYEPNYCYPGKHPAYHGAASVAMVNLAKRKGYRLVCTNHYGFNFIFVRNNEAEKRLPEISVEQALQQPCVAESAWKFDQIKDWHHVEG